MSSIPKRVLPTDGILRSLSERSTIRELREALHELRQRGHEAQAMQRIRQLLHGLPGPAVGWDLPFRDDAPHI